jgi:chromate reductase
MEQAYGTANGNVSALFDEKGKIKDNETVQILQTFVNAFVDLIKKYQA